jgi:O-antigen ligase
MVREQGGGWFAQQNVASAPRVRVVLQSGAPPSMPAPVQSVEPQPPSPSRQVLWGLALQLWRERPWLGIGPDVFRHVYGRALGISRPDTRVHTNSLYLETLTGSGLAGLAALAALLGLVGARSLRALAPGAALEAWRWWCLFASTLGLAAFVIHGVLDVFLAFTATYMLFYSWIGISAGLVNQEPRTKNQECGALCANQEQRASARFGAQPRA